MRPTEVFKFCPRCGAARAPENVGLSPLRCAGCAFTFYFNPTVAAAAWVFDPQGRALLIRREKDPAAGKFGIPGGFIDFGETAEDGLRREIREEVGLEVENVKFLMSCPNAYLFRDVTYPVVDLVFTATAISPERAGAFDGVTGIEWLLPRDVDPDELAFPSMRLTLAAVRAASA